MEKGCGLQLREYQTTLAEIGRILSTKIKDRKKVITWNAFAADLKIISGIKNKHVSHAHERSFLIPINGNIYSEKQISTMFCTHLAGNWNTYINEIQNNAARITTLNHAKWQRMWIQPTHWEAFSESRQEECTNT